MSDHIVWKECDKMRWYIITCCLGILIWIVLRSCMNGWWPKMVEYGLVNVWNMYKDNEMIIYLWWIDDLMIWWYKDTWDHGWMWKWWLGINIWVWRVWWNSHRYGMISWYLCFVFNVNDILSYLRIVIQSVGNWGRSCLISSHLDNRLIWPISLSSDN